MAIDLTGHCAFPIDEAQRRIVFARAARPEWFNDILILYDAGDLGHFGADIAREFGIEARCKFLLSVNDKSRVELLADAVEFIYQVFGTDYLVVTWGMDSIRPPERPYAPMQLERER